MIGLVEVFARTTCSEIAPIGDTALEVQSIRNIEGVKLKNLNTESLNLL